ncbi:MAG: hypothetical protein ACI8RZ_003578 [Myxococcota bacterium]|jgi:hypothetical protein
MWPVLVMGVGSLEVTITPIEDEEAHGLSGLSRAPDGSLWTVSERQRPRLIRLTEDGTAVQQRLPVTRTPWGYDLESVDWLDDDLLIFGTEHPVRGKASVLLATWEGNRVKVARTWPAGWGGLNGEIALNRGFEGICAGGGLIAVASETPMETSKGAVAPVYLIDQSNLDWYRPVVDETVYLPLPEGGTISALSCGPGEQVSAIVRGRSMEGAMRGILRYTVGAKQVEYFPLGEVLAPHNLEGLIADEGGWQAISDAKSGEAVWVDIRLR